jgi:hypothetical protein
MERVSLGRMGPRARRRLATVTGVVLLAAAGGVTYWMTHSGGRSHSTKEVYGTFGDFGVSYGTNERQLRAQVGTPDRKRNGCWIYRVRHATLGGSKLPQEVAAIDAVRYCFSEGVVSDIEDHWPPGFGWKTWNPPITFGCGGKKCVVRYSP